MKNAILILLLALGILPGYAQKTMPPSVQSYATNWSVTVVKALNKLGYDMPTMSAKPVSHAVQSRTEQYQLDSTVTFYEYDSPLLNDSTPLYRSTFEYPQPDVERQTNYQYENKAWLPIDRSFSTTDNLGRLVHVYSELFDPTAESFLPDSRLIAFPHGTSASLLDSFVVSQWDATASEWLVLFRGYNTYGSQDRILESVSTFDYLGMPLIIKDEYYYNLFGDNYGVASFITSDGQEYPSGRSQMTYENHLVVETIDFGLDDDGNEIRVSRTTNSYTLFGQDEQVDSYAWDLEREEWIHTEGVSFTYDSEQRVEDKETVIFHQDDPEERELIFYSYFMDEKLAVEHVFNWFAGFGYFLSDRKYYYYSIPSTAVFEPSANLPLAVMPNPSTNAIRLGLKAPAVVQLFNAQGTQLRNFVYHPDQVLNLSDLPDGIYFIQARQEGVVYAGKVLKY